MRKTNTKYTDLPKCKTCPRSRTAYDQKEGLKMTFCLMEGKDWILVRGICPLDPKPRKQEGQQAGGRGPGRDN